MIKNNDVFDLIMFYVILLCIKTSPHPNHLQLLQT